MLECPSGEWLLVIFPPAAAPVLLSTAAAPELLPAALILPVMLFCSLCVQDLDPYLSFNNPEHLDSRKGVSSACRLGEPKEGLLSLPGTPRPPHILCDPISNLWKEQGLHNSGYTKSKIGTPSLLSPLHTHSFIFLS